MSNMTFARLVLAAASNNPLPESQNWRLPPRQIAVSLVQYYMNSIYSLYPAFPETALYTALDQIYLPQQERTIKDADYWLVYLVLAVGSTAQSRRVDDDFYLEGLRFVCRARQHADRALMPGYTTQIRSLVLLTQYSLLDPAHFDSWHLIGFTCRAVIDLGFHQDPPREQLSNKAALDMRRKLFYCVYSLDRYDPADAADSSSPRQPTDSSLQVDKHGSCTCLLLHRRGSECGLAEALFV